jgi:hypothetical protein
LGSHDIGVLAQREKQLAQRGQEGVGEAQREVGHSLGPQLGGEGLRGGLRAGREQLGEQRDQGARSQAQGGGTPVRGTEPGGQLAGLS